MLHGIQSAFNGGFDSRTAMGMGSDFFATVMGFLDNGLNLFSGVFRC